MSETQFQESEQGEGGWEPIEIPAKHREAVAQHAKDVALMQARAEEEATDKRAKRKIAQIAGGVLLTAAGLLAVENNLQKGRDRLHQKEKAEKKPSRP